MLHPDKVVAILVNDLDSMVHYIEALPAHPSYTSALDHVQRAKVALSTGRTDLHQQEMKSRGDTLIVNPGESCGWLYGTPKAAILDLDEKKVEFLSLDPAHWTT